MNIIVQITYHEWGWQAKYLIATGLPMDSMRRWRRVDEMSLLGYLSNRSWEPMARLGKGWGIKVSLICIDRSYGRYPLSLVGLMCTPLQSDFIESYKFCTCRYGLELIELNQGLVEDRDHNASCSFQLTMLCLSMLKYRIDIYDSCIKCFYANSNAILATNQMHTPYIG